jgi:alkylation response protein AidB-like acyl-CoA dehydrogenase
VDFNLNDDQIAFKEMAETFAREELMPNAARWDKEEHFPIDVLKRAALLGLGGIYAGEDIGGSSLSRLDAAIIFSELSKGCISTSAYLSIHNMVVGIIDNYASSELKAQYGLKLTSMKLLSSYCLTEPGAGSDAASLKTEAKLSGDSYILNGTKAFISAGGVSDVYIVMARTGDASHRGISCFLVDKETKGLSFGKKEEKLGWHSQPTAMVFLEDCQIPKTHLIGEEGEGFKIALNALNGGRINIAACSLGGAYASLNACKQYMSERSQFKTKLQDFQALRFRFADMLTEIQAAKLMVYHAASQLDNKQKDAPLYCAMAKRLTTDCAFKISDEVLQIFGGYGYLCDYPIERIFRDLRVHRILEGTNEIMREIISKYTLKEGFLVG